ncbi:MAG TPA: hypothetical protein VH915_11315 [Pedococcus sp.]|jgi:hypothetical protein
MSIPADAAPERPDPRTVADPSDPSFGAGAGETPDPSFGPEADSEERVDYGDSDSAFGGDVGDAGWGRR